MSWWNQTKERWGATQSRWGRLRQAWQLTQHSPQEIEKALRASKGMYLGPRQADADRVGLHIPPLEKVTEPGGEGPRKPFGWSHNQLRVFARRNVWVRAGISIRQREVGGADWQVQPDLKHHKQELETLRQLVQAVQQFPDRRDALNDFKPGYVDPTTCKALIEATTIDGITVADIRYRFQLAYLDLALRAEAHAAPIRKLMKHPNGVGMGGAKRTWDDLLRPMVADLLTIDLAAWELGRARLPRDPNNNSRNQPTNKIVEVHWLDGATLRPVIDEYGDYKGDSDPQATSWEQWIDGQRVGPGFRSCDLMYIIENPQTDVRFRGYGYSRVETLANTLMLDAKGDKADGKEYDHAMYGGALVFQGVPGLNTQEDMDAMRSYYEEEIEGSYKLPMLAAGKEGEIKYVQTKMDPGRGDKSAVEKKKRYFLRVCAALDIPPIKMGVHEDVNRASAGSMKEIADEGLEHLLDIIGTSLTRSIAHDFGNDDIAIVGTIGAEDRKSELDIVKDELESCIIYVNDAKTQMGHEPVPDGDVPLVYYKKFQEEKAIIDAQATQEQSPGEEEPNEEANDPFADEAPAQDNAASDIFEQ